MIITFCMHLYPCLERLVEWRCLCRQGGSTPHELEIDSVAESTLGSALGIPHGKLSVISTRILLN